MVQDQSQNNTGYPFLFNPLKIGPLKIKNRIIVLPVHTGFAHTDGHVSSWLVKFCSRLAESGAGMVVVANTSVSFDGAVSRYNLRADKDEFIPGLAQLAKAIKKQGAVACLQLNHAGRFAKTPNPLLPSPITSSNLAFNVESLKDFMEFFPFETRFNLTRDLVNRFKTWRQSMTDDDRERVIDDFASSASRAHEAGFDMVELHGANGYLLCQYLSPFTNKIMTTFGGNIESRATFPLAVIKAIKERIPEKFPIGFRLILNEWVPGGIELPEALIIASIIEKAGVAYFSASAGTYNSIFSPGIRKKMQGTAYLEYELKKLKSIARIPVIASGRINTPSCANRIIKNGIADFVGLGRPLRTDPQWVKKAIRGDGKVTPCINCNWCLKRVVMEKGFNCRRWPRLHRDRTDLEHKLLTRNYKSLWVISSIMDMETFKRSWPYTVPDKGKKIYPTILIFKTFTRDNDFDSAQRSFIHWAKTKIDPLYLTHAPVTYELRREKNNWENTLLEEITDGGHGHITVCADKSEPWRERMLYKVRGKAMTMLSFNRQLHRVMVPIDFSPVSLLVMSFLRQTLMRRNDFQFKFVHVKQNTSFPVNQEWRKFKQIARLNKQIPIQVVPPSSTVISTLVETIKTQKYGTVVMGKHGSSGIKRWILGSVSSGVLRHLTDQTLFLID